MYAWIFRHLPGNLFWRLLQTLLLLAAVVAALFWWVFPWAADRFDVLDPSLG